MNVLKALDAEANYSKSQLQFILGAWVLSTLVDRKDAISTTDGDVDEDDYEKRSIYSLFYSLYRSMGDVPSGAGSRYELTFNTWGYEWPVRFGQCSNNPADPQRFGQNAYTGLYHFDEVKAYVAAREGRVHVVEMGCGTGAGANHVCSRVLPNCTYEAVDMQAAAIRTCERKFVPGLEGRLVATHSDATKLAAREATADFVAVNETHVTELAGQVTDEDERFFRTAYRMLKPGGFLVWGNAIPDSTWEPCFQFLESIGMERLHVEDVTAEAIVARDLDKVRVDAYVDYCIEAFYGFKIPMIGKKRKLEAALAMKNFYRNPGTRLYDRMVDGTDSYKVVLFRKM
jgi:ubiquinone/menaquinone biosynthesis C-methylase UbiE